MKRTKNLPADPQDRRFTAPWERVFNKILTPFEEFIHNQTTGSIILMVCAVLALLLANSGWAAAYQAFIETPLSISIGSYTLAKSLHYWVNEGLMTLFFFVMGLEIKRAILVGELASPRLAALPIIAALGGMIVPALLYIAINVGHDTLRGWGIPMATDIAFAVGVMVLLGPRIPKSLVMFLVALAIVDDLGAVLVIAVFYTDHIVFSSLAVAALLLSLLIVLNFGGIRHPLPYFLVTVALWFMLLDSGIHATIAGVLSAFAIPARPKYEPLRFSAHVRSLIDRFEAGSRRDKDILANDEQNAIARALEESAKMVRAPLQRLEHAFHLPVMLLVIPIFALTNAGVAIDADIFTAAFSHPLTLGIVAGLVAGKFIGIAGICWLALKLGIGQLPEHTQFRHIAGVGLLGGIGFTMSLFIAELGFTSAEHLAMAKLGILTASVIAGVVGYGWLLLAARAPRGQSSGA